MSLLLLFSNRWAPIVLPSLQAWLAADELGVTPVTAWPERSGHGNNAGSLGNDPDLAVAALNGMNAVQFTSANIDILTWLNVSSFTEGSVFYVAKAATNTQMGMPIGRTGTGGAFEQYNFAGTGGAVGSGFLSNAAHSSGAGVLGDVSQWHVLSIHSKAGEWAIRYNGTQVYTTATNTVAGFSGASFLGRDEVASAYFNGQLAEIFITNSAETTADRERAEAYLAWKWGLQANLPGGHTYASAPPTVALAYSLAAAVGSYTIAGTATGLKTARQLTGAVGSYSISGTATGLRVARKQAEAVGSYSISGTATVLRTARKLAEAVGSYSLSGTPAGLAFGRKLAAVVGSYSVSGTAVGLKTNRWLAGTVGSYALSGTATAVQVLRRLPAASGDYVLNGTAAGLIYGAGLVNPVLAISPGTYALTGVPAGFILTGSTFPSSGTVGVRVSAFFYRG